MVGLIRCRGKAGRIAALAVGALTLFALTLVAAPASAVPPADSENFSPSDQTASLDSPNIAAEEIHDLISDRNDGTNSTFHVNTVATLDASSVDWYYCPDTYNAAGDPTAGGSGCTLAGTDSSGEPESGNPQPGESYEMDFDVPDDGSHDWVAWICSTTPKTVANCFEDPEENIQFDDSSTGTAASQSPGGEITSPTNTSNVSDTGFAVTATTDPSVTEVGFCVEDADPGDPPDNGCQDSDVDTTPDNPAQQQSQFKTWSGFLDPGDGETVGIALFETKGGASSSLTINCTGDTLDCLLDTHYAGASPSVATSVVLAFEDFGEPSTLPNECDEAEAVQTAATTATAFITMEGCVFDQSLNQITDDVEWAFQVSPADPGALSTDTTGFEGLDGEENDTNGDDFFEQVDGDPGSSGTHADQEPEFHAAGTYTVVFCVDSDDNADDFSVLPPQSATPCSGETLSQSGTITITEPVDHVHVKKQGTEGPQCHTGSSTTTAPAGSTVNLVGCTLGVVPNGTEGAAAGVHVLWFVNPANNPQDPGQIATQENTSDASGKADAAISSGGGAAEKTTTVRFCVDEFPATGGAGQGNGICDAGEPGGTPGLQADFQINWTAAAAPPGGACPLKKKVGSSGDDNLSGGPGCDKLLGKKGEDKLKGKGGTDVLVGGPGDDILIGGPGDDKCRGGAGQDKLKNC